MFSRRRMLLAGLVAAATGVGAAQEPAKKDEPNGPLRKPEPPIGRPLALGECLALAEQHQPRVRAAQLSLQAAELGLQGLGGLGRVAERLSPDLPVRRQQSALGLRAAQAEVDKVRQETVYDVTYLYWSHVYARQSEQTASDVVEQLDGSARVIREIIELGAPAPGKIDRLTLYNLQNLIDEVRILQIKAEAGRRQSLAALREAVGATGLEFHPASPELPLMDGAVDPARVVAEALARRPELAQAAAGVDVFNLEPCAQARVRLRPQVNTLAAGTDLHKTLVPLPLRNGQYRPGAVAPEMPTSLVGNTDDRVARAGVLAARQSALYDVAVGLVRLDAETAYSEWRTATDQVGLARRRFETARRRVDDARTAAAARQDPQLLANAEMFAGRAQAAYIEAVYEHVKSLAKLERVTAGGVRANFPLQ